MEHIEEAMNTIEAVKDGLHLAKSKAETSIMQGFLYGQILLLEYAICEIAKGTAADSVAGMSTAEVKTQDDDITYGEKVARLVAREHDKELYSMPGQAETDAAFEALEPLMSVAKSQGQKNLRKKEKALYLWRDKGYGATRLVEACDITLEQAARWIREFSEVQK